ncbi:hypothetical protein [Vibrio phage vB_VibM_83AMN]|nr:hypothetical protein [Vibrio phage vB_VibM_83AMN]
MLYSDELLFDIEADAYCVTTNGLISKKGLAVMGRGVALSAKKRFSGIDKNLANSLKLYGNRPNIIYNNPIIISLPTKHNWYSKGDYLLIEKSLTELVLLVNFYGFTKIALPKPGCSNGKLSWCKVKMLCEKYLDDRFIVSTF